MQGTLRTILSPPPIREPEAGCEDGATKKLPAMRLPRLSKANTFRQTRSASVESIPSHTNVADDQAFVKGPPKKAAKRKRNMVPCRGPIRHSGSPTLDFSLRPIENFFRTSSVDSIVPTTKVATLKQSSTVLKIQQAAAHAASIQHFTKSITLSVDSLRDQIRATYETCEKANGLLARISMMTRVL